MSLTIGNAPFGSNPGAFNFERSGPAHVLYFEDSPRRVRVMLGGEVVADSRRVKLLHETGLLPVYYFPEQDVRRELLTASDHTTRCPFKGEARYWTVEAGGKRAESAVWYYPEPIDGAPPLRGYVAFYWDRMDAWYEEDEPIRVHARDPFHRVDVLRSSRHVKVALGGRLLAESQQPMLLFETGLPTRYYLQRDDVDASLLVDSSLTSECAYKGVATYHSVRVGDELHENLVWTYRHPLPEVAAIEGRLCFYDEKVDVELDGEALPRPKTKWS